MDQATPAQGPPVAVTDRVMSIIIALLVVLVGAVGLFAATRTPTGTVVDELGAARPVIERQLSFVDADAGLVLVLDADSGEQLAEFGAGEGSFVRGVMRSMTRQRRGMGIEARDPFTLTRYSNGGLVLADPLTGLQMELAAFGPDNAAVFAALLPGEVGAR